MTYDYDDIGNLVKDSDAEIDTVYWGVNGKMKGILRSSGSTKEGLAFDYDPSGNRIAKHVYKPGGQLAYSTYYVRDAQGNIMSTYTFTDTASTPSFAMREQHLYGSSRLGIRKDSVELSIPVNLCNSPYSLSIAGLKQYELTNHLGNVLSVISDRKLPYNSSGSGSISYFQPEIVSATDYYPFGMVMPGRSHTSGTDYRYGFNGQEKVDEINGAGNHNTALFWEYDTRLGRRWNLDPVVKFWQSSYACFSNSPIWKLDPNGDDDYYSRKGAYLGSVGESNGIMRVETEDHTYAKAKETGEQQGKIITVDPGIGNEIKRMASNTFGSGREYVLNIIFDPDKANIYAEPDNDATASSGDPYHAFPERKASFDSRFDPKVQIGTIHGHPPEKRERMKNKSGFSGDDKQVAKENKRTDYAVDSYQIGQVDWSNPYGSVHRVNPDGSESIDITKIKDVGTGKGEFNIGKDALEKTGGKK